ncbi:MAG: hypothetical protein H6706_19920 [Myxococcales bacterium]|nr:hypothetical protein [Myxococcales bacterium]
MDDGEMPGGAALEEAVALMDEGHAERAAARFGEAIRIAVAEGAAESETLGRLGQASAFMALGRWAEAREAGLAAHAVALQAIDRATADHCAGVVGTVTMLATLYPEGGAMDRAAGPRMEAALAAYRAAETGEAEAACLREAVEAARAGRLPGQEAGALAGLAGVIAGLGDVAGAREALERARLIAELTGQEAAEAHFTQRLRLLEG